MTYRILALSGGGVRGLFQARFLVEAEEWLEEKPLAKNFNLIAGTSTGGIIALALALGVPASQIFELYKNLAKRVFPRFTFRYGQWTPSYLFKGPLYDNKPLRKALEPVFAPRGRTPFKLEECCTSVVIPATYLNEFDLHVFKSLRPPNDNPANAPDNRGASDDDSRHAIEVALATTAAPLFFPAYKPSKLGKAGMVDTREYVDGGLWANNPALAAVMIANKDLGVAFEDMRVISIGNGESPTGTVATNYNQMRRLELLRPTLDMMFATQAEMAQRYVAMLIKHEEGGIERLLRINTSMSNLIALDDVKRATAELPGRARQAAGIYRDRFVTLARNDRTPSAIRCDLARSAVVEVSRLENQDTSDLFYIFIVVRPVMYLRAVRRTFERWIKKLNDDEPNGIEIIGVYDVYGSFDIVVCARATQASCETVKRHIQDQLRVRNTEIEQPEGNDLRIRDARKEYLWREAVPNDVAVRAMRAFCEIELPVPTDEYVDRMFTDLEASIKELKGARLIAFNWCGTHVVAEFYVACGGYYELSSVIQSIETHVASDARNKTTWLSFSSWERSRPPVHQRRPSESHLERG